MLQASTIEFVEQHLTTCQQCQKLVANSSTQNAYLPMKRTVSFFMSYLLYYPLCLPLTRPYSAIKRALSSHMHFSAVFLTFSIKHLDCLYHKLCACIRLGYH